MTPNNALQGEKKAIKKQCIPNEDLEAINTDPLLFLKSRNCFKNIQTYKTEMRELTGFANPQSFMTVSHSNLTRNI